MRVVVGFMIHIELSIVEQASGVVIVGDALVHQRVLAIQVFHLNAVRNVPGDVELRTALLEGFPVESIAGGADIFAFG